MAGLEGLASMIYHERQQPGSMLCAQHALNSLLQGNYFTAADLSVIANSLDMLEESYDDANEGHSSTNMDDTGFFSVQVLENALKVWGLTTVRWRSETMRPYHAHPETQLAFILNYQQHWFTLRRFGPALANLENDPGEGHWFNLNSFLSSPEWVGKLYLGMVIQQAEDEGYSVFAICQADPSAPLALPRIEADEIASTLPQPTSSHYGARLTTARTSSSSSSTPTLAGSSSSTRPMPGDFPTHIEGLEDEDMELQAALQASLMGGDHLDSSFVLPPRPLEPLGLPISGVGSGGVMEGFDPVAASMARNKAIMDRMMREQAAALRGGYEEEVEQRFTAPTSASSSSAGVSGRRFGEVPVTEEDEVIDVDEDEDRGIQRLLQQHSQRLANRRDDDMIDVDEEGSGSAGVETVPLPTRAPAFAYEEHRVYDDDDAELQAALRASLEGVPEDFRFPASPPSRGRTVPLPPVADPPAPEVKEQSVAPEEDEPPAIVEDVSVDELRRRRLARFGG